MIAVALLAFTLQSPVDSVTLPEALQSARAGPRAKAIAAGVDLAVAERRVAGLIPNPNAAMSRVDQISSRRLTVTQPLAWLPRRGADLSAAASSVEGARFDSVQSTADLMRDVRVAFFGALAADEEAKLTREQAAIAESLATLAAKRAIAGDISDFERDQIAQEATKARILASEQGAAARDARAQLGQLMAWESPAPPRPAGALDDGLLSAPPVGATSELPAARAASLMALAARAMVRATQWSRVPVPGLFIERDWNTLSPATTRLGVSLPIPVFSQGGEQVALARARSARLDAVSEETRVAARTRLAVALANLDDARIRARLARDTLVVQARRLREGTVRLYEAGRASVLEVLEALRTERDANAILVRTMRDFQKARAEVDAALGVVP